MRNNAFLRHEKMEMLRILTCGSVDDGKSTLIGRMLFDSRNVYEDQLQTALSDSRKLHCADRLDLSLLTDGLKAEREQGITIDVAYRYFATDKRKFVIADCPGHEQYTRNMATGAANCDLAIILVDAQHGITRQTRRHAFICSLLGIHHAVVVVNKMDQVDWAEDVFEKIVTHFNGFAARLDFADYTFIPTSALKGDNVVASSAQMPWYKGAPLLHHLERVNIATDRNLIDLRFPVQYVIRSENQYRGLAGTVASGVIRRGAHVMILPERKKTTIERIVTMDGDREYAYPPMAISVVLADNVDASRGSMLVYPNNLPHTGHFLDTMLIWMSEQPCAPGQQFIFKHAAENCTATITAVRYKMDMETLHRKEVASETTKLQLNEIARVSITLHKEIVYDEYKGHVQTGAYILIDRITNLTVGAGMIQNRITEQPDAIQERLIHAKNIVRSNSLVSPEMRGRLLARHPKTIWLTGLSGSGKSTIAKHLEKELFEHNIPCYLLDGDNIRHGLNRDLGFSQQDRTENIRRVAEVARLFNQAGLHVIAAFISPYRRDRAHAKQIIGHELFVEVFVNAPLNVCEARDPKGLYKQARSGIIPMFTGVTAPYEPPEAPAVQLRTDQLSVSSSVQSIINCLAVLNRMDKR